MSYKQESADNIDLERYLNFDQTVLSPGSSASSKRKAIPTPELQTPTSNRAFLAQQQQHAQPMFSGPSHQYDQHTQQTGLPSGALANALAANRNTAFHLGGYSNNLGGSSAVDFDFSAPMAHQQSFESADMDMDFNTPLDGFYSSEPNSGFVDPNMIGGNEDVSSPPARNDVVRMWPGMHTRQAELAKQQQQQEILRQQQMKAGQQQQPQQAQQAQGHKRNTSKSSNGNRQTDPIIEERISRLLNQMRHGSVGSSNDESATPQPSNNQSARQKKDEEEMDEDERLLASEEGKKLSSKERRQLRNKVSARAFRSRRKEYIGQLEGEIALKGQEADELRAENEALKIENNRLTDLSKMLLSSPAFSNFLNDLSANGMPQAAALGQQQQASQPQPQQQVPKDINASRHMQMQQQNNAHIGMTLLPERNMDFLSPADGNWNTGMDFNFSGPQVYAVTELPQPPALESVDTGALSGKSSNFVPSISDSEAKSAAPAIEAMPKPIVSVETVPVDEPTAIFVDDSVELDESDPAFALYVDCPSATTSSPSEPEYNIFGDIHLEKAVARFDMVIEGEETTASEVNTAVMARFEVLCSSLDAVCSRISDLTI